MENIEIWNNKPHRFTPSDIQKDMELYSLGKISNLTDLVKADSEQKELGIESIWVLASLLRFIDNAKLLEPESEFLELIGYGHEIVHLFNEFEEYKKMTKSALSENQKLKNEFVQTIKRIGEEYENENN